jgi:hypothetical protein
MTTWPDRPHGLTASARPHRPHGLTATARPHMTGVCPKRGVENPRSPRIGCRASSQHGSRASSLASHLIAPVMQMSSHVNIASGVMFISPRFPAHHPQSLWETHAGRHPASTRIQPAEHSATGPFDRATTAAETAHIRRRQSALGTDDDRDSGPYDSACQTGSAAEPQHEPQHERTHGSTHKEAGAHDGNGRSTRRRLAAHTKKDRPERDMTETGRAS